jgi:hypothetical protein
MSAYYDRQGQPIGLMQWMKLFEDREYQRVALDEYGEIRVSTVWLGLDHNWGNGAKAIFETMVFGGKHDEEQWRYATEAEARAGHAEVCSAVFRSEP